MRKRANEFIVDPQETRAKIYEAREKMRNVRSMIAEKQVPYNTVTRKEDSTDKESFFDILDKSTKPIQEETS